MSEQKPPNPPAKLELQFDAYLRAARKALQKQRAIPKPPESLIKFDDEKKTLEVDKLRLENKKLTNKLEEAEDLHKVRKRYTNRLFWLIVFWLLVVITFIGLAGFHVKGFTMSNTVIVAFITSTTVSVLGLFLIPAKWLFPSKEEG
ncbi:MAG: hypothetical protein M3Y84_03405 [Acidobacteriota bacterium]|nr:hypothetical protein [Acidobacteriota bacterium]